MHRVDVWRMIRRRAKGAGIVAEMCCYTFRAIGITPFSTTAAPSKTAQAMAAHEGPRMTKLHDRRSDEITLSKVERIAI